MPSVLIVIGLIFLLENLNLIPWLNWSVIWPVVLILAGLHMMRKKKCGDGCCGWSGGKKEEDKK